MTNLRIAVTLNQAMNRARFMISPELSRSPGQGSGLREVRGMAYKHIQTELKDGVATLTLNRAPVNVLNIEMMEEINTYLEGLKKEKSLKLLVIQAMGKAFSAGVDVGEHLGDLVYKMIEVFHKMFRLMDALKVPSIAVVNGSALGGGCELALYCDMVIATEKSKFGQPEIQVGVFPPIAALIFPRMIGRKKAMELDSFRRYHQCSGSFGSGFDQQSGS